MNRFAVFASLLVCIGFLAPQPCFADQHFDYAMSLYKRRDFRNAVVYFNHRLKVAPNDERALFYKAVSLYYIGETVEARQLYEHIALQFPNTQYGKSAAAAVEKMAGGLGTALSNKSSLGAAPRNLAAAPAIRSNIPAETRVYFKTVGKSIMLPGKVNGCDFNFLFDTASPSVLIKKEDFDNAKLHIPATAKTHETTGIGGKIQSKVFDADVTIGGITRRVPIKVTEAHAPDNILGQSWLGDLEYEVDHKSDFIAFRPPRAAEKPAASRSPSVVPFTVRGPHMIVDVTHRGRKTKMMVDTGSQEIRLTKKNLTDLGLEIPASAVTVDSENVGTKRQTINFTIDELRLGEIAVQNPEVAYMIESAEDKDEVGMLGMTFFQGWHYTVDRKNQVLRFSR